MQKGYFKTRRQANNARKKGEVVYFSKFFDAYYLRKPRVDNIAEELEEAVRQLLENGKKEFAKWQNKPRFSPYFKSYKFNTPPKGFKPNYKFLEGLIKMDGKNWKDGYREGYADGFRDAQFRADAGKSMRDKIMRV